jgi:hypothetical protein
MQIIINKIVAPQQDGSLTFGKPIVFHITIPNAIRNNRGAISICQIYAFQRSKDNFGKPRQLRL